MFQTLLTQGEIPSCCRERAETRQESRAGRLQKRRQLPDELLLDEELLEDLGFSVRRARYYSRKNSSPRSPFDYQGATGNRFETMHFLGEYKLLAAARL